MGKEKSLDHQEMDNYENEVFVSYAWGGESERMVDELEKAFAEHGVSIKRDKKTIDYKGSIKEFERRLSRGECVVTVISDRYLKSEHCMRELVEVDNNQNVWDRIFPIVLPDAGIHNVKERLNYIVYWGKQIKDLNATIKKSVDELSGLSSIVSTLDQYRRNRASIGHLTDLLSDMNTQTAELLESQGFLPLIQLIKQRMINQRVIALGQDYRDLGFAAGTQIEITLSGNSLKIDFTEICRTLAIILSVNEQSIEIIKVEKGSVKIVIELAEKAAFELRDLYRRKDPRLFKYLNVIDLSFIEGKSAASSRGQQKLYKSIVAHDTQLERSHSAVDLDVQVEPSKYPNLVGRDGELNKFRRTPKNPYGGKRILLLLGSGGIGKTMLLRKMLIEAHSTKGVFSATEPIDLFSTDYRHIDGIQRKIKEIVEALPELKGKPSPFADFSPKKKTDTSEKFYECLKAFCAEHPLVLAFDTFENLDKVASDWLFRGEPNGLQVSGLICIIAGRDKQIFDIDMYQTNPLVKEIRVPGFTLEEADKFYKGIINEFIDPVGALLSEAGLERAYSTSEGIKRIWQLTEGHPLKLEMAFRWLGLFFNEQDLAGITPGKFEEQLMKQVQELADTGKLDVAPDRKVSQPVFDTLLCMAYITRRFDEHVLRHLINKKLIRLDDPNVSEKDILENLERYFFVKVRLGNKGERVLQLHDEMARLVREYVWPFHDPSGQKKQELLAVVDEFYSQLISESTGEEADTLRVEKLYYALKRDWRDEGKKLWLELAEMNNENINKLLPGEIDPYLKGYDMETQVALHSRLAEMESKARHRNHALGHWETVRKLGVAEKRDDWVVDALVGKFNTVAEQSPERAHKEYLMPAKRLAETNAPGKLATVYYEIGFAYRLMQKINKAVLWYGKALDESRKRPGNQVRKAAILNDRGYAYAQLGRWGFTTRDVREALKIRQGLLRADRERLKNTKPGEREKLERAVAESARRVGMSHNTLGDFDRYADHLEDARKQYEDALELFKEADDNYWQAKALCGLGETYRRQAREAKDRGDWDECENLLVMALDRMQDSLYLCRKYQLDSERETACRRIGRLFHDRALIAIARHEGKKLVREHLKSAHDNFEEGLKYALETQDALEELENRTEMAFLLDDAVEALGAKNVPAEFRNALEELEQALEKHRDDPLRIYQYPVFENLMLMERAAIAFAHGKYSKALAGYLEAYKGLGSSAGYGIARYRQHLDHLKVQIQKLPRKELKREWCNKFIQVWGLTVLPGSKPRRYLADDLPNLVEWCYSLLADI